MTHSVNQQSTAATLQDDVPNQLALVKQLTVEQLGQWLLKHPEIGSDYQNDIERLRGLHNYYSTTNHVAPL